MHRDRPAVRRGALVDRYPADAAMPGVVRLRDQGHGVNLLALARPSR